MRGPAWRGVRVCRARWLSGRRRGARGRSVARGARASSSVEVAADRDSGRGPGRPRGSPWLQRRARPRSRGASGVAPLTAGT